MAEPCCCHMVSRQWRWQHTANSSSRGSLRTGRPANEAWVAIRSNCAVTAASARRAAALSSRAAAQEAAASPPGPAGEQQAGRSKSAEHEVAATTVWEAEPDAYKESELVDEVLLELQVVSQGALPRSVLS